MWNRPFTAALTLLATLGDPCTALAAGEASGYLHTPAGAVAVMGDSIPAPLTAAPADVERGRAVFLDRDRGHCLLCHAITALDEPFQGNIGPELTGAGARLSVGQLRLRVVDASHLNPNTIMPPYFRTEDLHDVQADYRNRPVLNAQEVEDVIAYLDMLGTPHD